MTAPCAKCLKPISAEDCEWYRQLCGRYCMPYTPPRACCACVLETIEAWDVEDVAGSEAAS